MPRFGRSIHFFTHRSRCCATPPSTRLVIFLPPGAALNVSACWEIFSLKPQPPCYILLLHNEAASHLLICHFLRTYAPLAQCIRCRCRRARLSLTLAIAIYRLRNCPPSPRLIIPSSPFTTMHFPEVRATREVNSLTGWVVAKLTYICSYSTNDEHWTLDDRKPGRWQRRRGNTRPSTWGAGSFWRRLNVSVHAIFLSHNMQFIVHDVVNRKLNARSVLG